MRSSKEHIVLATTSVLSKSNTIAKNLRFNILRQEPYSLEITLKHQKHGSWFYLYPKNIGTKCSSLPPTNTSVVCIPPKNSIENLCL